MIQSKKRGDGRTLLILMLGCGAVLYVVFTKAGKEYVLQEPKEDPEVILQEYLEAAWDYSKNQADGAGSQLKLHTYRPDWLWYEANYESLIEDGFGILANLGMQEKAVKMKLVLKAILEEGAYRPDCELTLKNKTNLEAIFNVKQLRYQAGSEKSYDYIEVRLVNEERHWKIKDFAGGLNEIGGGVKFAPGL